MVETTMDVSGWLRKRLEDASPDLLRAMGPVVAKRSRHQSSELRMFASSAGCVKNGE